MLFDACGRILEVSNSGCAAFPDPGPAGEAGYPKGVLHSLLLLDIVHLRSGTKFSAAVNAPRDLRFAQIT